MRAREIERLKARAECGISQVWHVQSVDQPFGPRLPQVSNMPTKS